jgi:hypothetical protein
MDRLQPFLASTPCRRCSSHAYWAVDGQPLCHVCLCGVASVSKAQADLVSDALISPELVSVSSNEVKLRIYDTTCIAPICSMLDQLPLLFPEMDAEAEIILERWQNRPMPLGADQIVCTGMGYYHIDSRTLGPVLCHAPLIKLARAPIGRMAGFMKLLNDHSLRIRECVMQEFREEETTNA